MKKEDKWCPLHLAAFNGHVECVEALLNAGADITIKNVHSFFPFPLSLFFFLSFFLSFSNLQKDDSFFFGFHSHFYSFFFF